jgi:aminoglycoside 6'-N-acetyltransferase
LKQVAREGPLVIREMQESEADLRLFLKWMTDPQTMKYWDGMSEHYTYERVLGKYRAHIGEGVCPCIIEYEGTPIGYFQFYPVDAREYELPEDLYARFTGGVQPVYGIDMFLGETQYRDRGIGTQSLRLLMKALFSDYQAQLLLIDPKVHNARAIRCYRKCGFADYFILPHRELQDGVYHDSLIMGAKRDAAPPGLLAPPALTEKGISFFAVEEADFPAYLRIKRECFLGYVERYYGGWEEQMQHRMNREIFEKCRRQSCFEKVLLYGETAGFLSFDEQQEKIDGITLQLSEKIRNGGIGSFFLQELTVLADKTGKPAFLRVFRSNPARRLYQRFGFQESGGDDIHCRMAYTPARQ